MRAVWSFWHEPFAAHREGAWGTVTNHLLAWALSVRTARRHYPDTVLVTDDAGAELLVDGLGLDFGEVSLSLDGLRGCDPSWWSMGKLVAVAEQREPFVHLDADVFLWKPLPAELAAAPVFTQNPEPFAEATSWYDPESFEAVLGGRPDTWLPPEWAWHRTPGARPRGECCGIVGGTRLDFLHHWAAAGLRVVREPGNQQPLALLHRPPLTITVEQYLLSACVEHHRDRPGSPYRDVGMAYLFESWAAAGSARRAAQAGFTHLIADTKRDPANARRLDRRVRRDLPELWERAHRLGGTAALAGAA